MGSRAFLTLWTRRSEFMNVPSFSNADAAGSTTCAKRRAVSFTNNVMPHEVRKSIEAALARHAEREAMRVGLDVQDGRVILSGVVHSWTEKETVLGAARGTPGVRTVDDRLRIEPRAA
jgi:osmotically-inducible protein OsmY